MKRIHYKQIFEKNPNIEKQFGSFLKTMKANSFEEALKHLKHTEDKNEYIVYAVKSRLFQDEESVKINNNLLLPEDFFNFISSALKNNGYIPISSPDIENKFPEIKQESDFIVKKEDLNIAFYDWENTLNSAQEVISNAPIIDFKDFQLNDIIIDFNSRTPEEQAQYLISKETQNHISGAINDFFRNNEKNNEIHKKFILEFLRYPKIDVEFFSNLYVFLNSSQYTPSAINRSVNQISESKKTFIKELLDEINKDFKSILFRNDNFFISLEKYYKWEINKNSKENNSCEKIPDYLLTEKTIAHLCKKNIKDNIISSEWLSKIENLKILYKFDTIQKSELVKFSCKKEIYDKYLNDGIDSFTEYFEINYTGRLLPTIKEENPELLLHYPIFKKTFLFNCLDLERYMNKKNPEEFQKMFTKFLENELPENIAKKDKEFLEKFSKIMQNDLGEQSILIIEKWLPFILEQDSTNWNTGILNKIDFKKHKDIIYKSFSKSYNSLVSPIFLSFFETKDPNVYQNLLEIKPSLYKEKPFAAYRNKRNTIKYFEGIVADDMGLSIQLFNNKLTEVPPEMFYDIDCCIALISTKNTKHINLFPHHHFKNLNFIIPMLKKIGEAPDNIQNEYILRLPKAIVKFIKNCPQNVNKGEYLYSFLQRDMLNKTMCAQTTQAESSEETTSTPFKI